MPLSKARDKERKRLAKHNSNLIVSSGSNSNLIQPKVDALQSKSSPLKGGGNGKLPTKEDRLAIARTALANPRKVGEDKPDIIPFYDPRVHNTGDRVRMMSGSGKVIEVTVPELDADRNPLW